MGVGDHWMGFVAIFWNDESAEWAVVLVVYGGCGHRGSIFRRCDQAQVFFCLGWFRRSALCVGPCFFFAYVDTVEKIVPPFSCVEFPMFI